MHTECLFCSHDRLHVVSFLQLCFSKKHWESAVDLLVFAACSLFFCSKDRPVVSSAFSEYTCTKHWIECTCKKHFRINLKGDSADPHIVTALNLLKQLAKLSSKKSREPCAQSISDQSACSLSAPSNSQYACSEQTYANRSSFLSEPFRS